MTYAVTRQRYWLTGEYVVEVAIGGFDYSNPDALSPKYKGEMKEYICPIKAVETAIQICEEWKNDEPTKNPKIAIGCTHGFTAPFEPTTYKKALSWAKKQKKLEKRDKDASNRFYMPR